MLSYSEQITLWKPDSQNRWGTEGTTRKAERIGGKLKEKSNECQKAAGIYQEVRELTVRRRCGDGWNRRVYFLLTYYRLKRKNIYVQVKNAMNREKDKDKDNEKSFSHTDNVENIQQD